MGNKYITVKVYVPEEGLAALYVARETSQLRETPDKDWADEFIYGVYSKIVKESS